LKGDSSLKHSIWKLRISVIAITVGIAGWVGYRTFYPSFLDYRKYLTLSGLAAQGDPGYQRLLAEYFYEKGNFEAALKWEVKSAAGGDPIAQNFMGYYFSGGINEQMRPRQPDYSQAREWFEKAALQDFESSQFELCNLYHRGLGVEPDQEAAYFWCSLSEPLEQAVKLKILVRERLDKEALQRVENKLIVWKGSRRKSVNGPR